MENGPSMEEVPQFDFSIFFSHFASCHHQRASTQLMVKSVGLDFWIRGIIHPYMYMYVCIYIYIWVNYNDLTTTSLEIMVTKGNHPQMALIQVSELL